MQRLLRLLLTLLVLAGALTGAAPVPVYATHESGMPNPKPPVTPTNLPPLLPKGMLTGTLIFRDATRNANGLFDKSPDVKLMDMATLDLLDRLPTDYEVTRFRLVVNGEEHEIGVTRYTDRTGKRAIISGGLTGSVSPDGTYAFVRVKEGNEYYAGLVPIPWGTDCSSKPCPSVWYKLSSSPLLMPLALPRVGWGPDGTFIAWTEAVWLPGGAVSVVVSTPPDPYWIISSLGKDCNSDPIPVYADLPPGPGLCRHSAVKFSPDGKQLLVAEPAAGLRTYPWPFYNAGPFHGRHVFLRVEKLQQVDNASWSPDGKWAVYTRRFCTTDGRDAQGRRDDCGWMYGQTQGYIGVVNAETGEEYRLTDLFPIPLGGTADLVWLDTPVADWNLKAVPANGAVQLTWNGQPDAGGGYYIYRTDAPGAAPGMPVNGDFPLSGTAYRDDAVIPGQTYYYRVQLVKADGKPGLRSPEVAVTIPDRPRRTILMKLNSPTAQVNGTATTLDVPPQLIQGRVMVPFRFLATALGADMDWNTADRSVTYTLNNQRITLWVDQKTALVNGKQEPLDVPATMVGTRLVVPIRFLSTHLGASIIFSQADQSIEVVYPK